MIKILSGAGISQESNIPTFRGSDSLWEKYDPNLVSNIVTYHENKKASLDFHNMVDKQMNLALPNKAHFGFKELELLVSINHPRIKNIRHYTQNIDDLLEKAGCKEIIHIHGKKNKIQCLECLHQEDINYELSLESICPKCGSNDIKPGTVFFNENSSEYRNMYADFASSTDKDIIIITGTSGNVIPIPYICHNDAIKILVNYESEPMINEDYFDYKYFGKITKNIDDIVELIRNIND